MKKMDADKLERVMMYYSDPAGQLDPQMEYMIKSVPQEVLEQYWVRQINKVLKVAQKSAFWRKKLKGLTSITRIEELEKITITTRDEINALIEKGNWQDMLTIPPTEITHIITSGKTAQRPPFISGMTDHEYSCNVSEIMRMFFWNNLKPTDTILIVFPGKYIEPEWVVKLILQRGRKLEEYKSNHVAGTIFRDAARRYGMNVVSTGLPMLAFKKSAELAKREAPIIMDVYEKVRPRILATSPNIISNCILPSLKEKNMSFLELGTEIIILGGQKVNVDLLEYLEKKENVHVTSWLESGEVCTIGYSHNERTEKGFVGFIPAYLCTFFEIVDEKGRQVSINKRGRLIATRLLTTGQPLIRYFMEDETAFVNYNKEFLFDPNFVKLI
jgi:phenylacetate-coenzyme A ligase PaaK-like adenylate-forming protein